MYKESNSKHSMIADNLSDSFIGARFGITDSDIMSFKFYWLNSLYRMAIHMMVKIKNASIVVNLLISDTLIMLLWEVSLGKWLKVRESSKARLKYKLKKSN